MDETKSASGYYIRAEREAMDLEFVYASLTEKTYWAKDRSLETVRRSFENSLCLGAFSPRGKQVGFARVVTDYATFGWLCDVFVDEEHRGRGLGKLLVEAVVSEPRLMGLRRILLATRDAQELYRRYGGFEKLENPDRWMERLKPQA